MTGKIALNIKSPLADFTLVRSFSGVNSLMIHQVTFVLESPEANLAEVFVFQGVGLQMLVHNRIPGRGEGTKDALELFFVGLRHTWKHSLCVEEFWKRN